MEFAEKEYHKKNKKVSGTTKLVSQVPVWVDKKIEDGNMTKEEEEELNNLLKEFK